LIRKGERERRRRREKREEKGSGGGRVANLDDSKQRGLQSFFYLSLGKGEGGRKEKSHGR